MLPGVAPASGTAPASLNIDTKREGDTEELYVVADLGDEANAHLLKPGAKFSIKGLDTESPEIVLDGVKFEGQYEDVIGTLMMLSTHGEVGEPECTPSSGGNADDAKVAVSFKCHTQSRIKFTKKLVEPGFKGQLPGGDRIQNAAGGGVGAGTGSGAEMEIDQVDEKTTPLDAGRGSGGHEGEPVQESMDKDDDAADGNQGPQDPRVQCGHSLDTQQAST